MTLTMGLRYKNPDASADINLRLKDVAKKGFVSGGAVTPVSGVLQVSVAPFVCINYDGAVVRSDANVVLNPGDGIVNVVFLRARYVPLGSPIMQVQVAPVTSYLTDPEFDWLTVLAVVDLTVGAPHTAVDPSEIVYSWTDGVDTVERHAVDQQGRSFYRDPVENSGDLFTPGSLYLPPLADNRNGDVRLAVDTGSFYWWNEAGGLWEVFDEVPLNMHREHEHTNGITGDSDATTLQPSSLASTALIAAVPAGSGYTVNGRYVTAPTPMPFSQNLAGDPKFSSRGLVQASSDQLGVVTLEDSGNGDYRVKLTDPLSIAAARIIDISDAHGLGLFTLRFDPATGLSWADGEPVNVGVGTATGGDYRLYTPDYANWVDVRLTAGDALPGAVTDVYEVFASKKDDEHFLIGYFFWNGTAITDVTDKRYFGNLGTQELADEFKETLKTEWTDLRGNMVYSGGAMSVIGGLTMRITGPLIAYVGGKRFVVPVTTGVGNDGYTGITFPGAGAPQTRFVYVDAAGVLTLSATDPNTVPGLEFAEVGRVVGTAGTIVTNEDRRDPQLIVGQATRNARVIFSASSALVADHASSLTRTAYKLQRAGVNANTDLHVGKLHAEENELHSVTGPLVVIDDVTGLPNPVTDAANTTVTSLQPGETAPSILGAIAATQAAAIGVGVLLNGCVPSSIGAGVVSVTTGRLVTPAGKLITLDAIDTTDLSAEPDDIYVVYVDGSGVNHTVIGALDWRDNFLPVAVVNVVAGLVTDILDIRCHANGSMLEDSLSITHTTGSAFSQNRGNFKSLKAAMAFIGIFDTNQDIPRVFTVLGAHEEPSTIDVNAFPFQAFTASSALVGMQVKGVAAGSFGRAKLLWGTDGVVSAAPLLDCRNEITSVTFKDLQIEYLGNTGVNNDNCWLKNPGANLVVENCDFAPQTGVGQPLRCLVRYDVTTSLGGTTASLIPGALFKNCNFFDICAGTEVLSLETAALAGRIAIENCVFGGTSTYARVVNISSATATCDVTFDNCRVGAFNSAIIEAPVGVTGKLQVVNSTISASPGAALGPSSGTLDVINCVISESVSAYGTRLVSGCRLVGAAGLTGNSSTTFQDCDFFYQTTGRFTGSFKDLLGCSVRLGLDGRLEDSGSNDWIQTIDNCYISKSNDNANTNTWFDSAFRGTLFLSNTYVHYSGSSTDANALFQATGPGSQFYISNTHIRAGNRGVGNGAFTFSIRTAGISPGVVKISDCTVTGLFGSAIFVTHDAGVDDNSSSVIITGCHVSSSVSGVPAIYILGNLTGTGLQIGKVLVNGNTFDLGPAGNAILMEGFVHGEFNDNIVNSISTSQGLVQLGGSDVSELGLQESVTCCRNVFRANAHGYLIHVIDINKYANVSDNTMVVSAAGNVTCQIALDYTFLAARIDERVFMANHNQLTAITSSTTASVVAGILLDTGLSAGGNFGKAFAIGNHIYAGKSLATAGTAEAEIAFDSGPPSESVISNNVIEVLAAGGVGTCTCRTSGESAVMTDNIFHMNAGNTMNTANNATNRKGGTAANVGVVEENIEDLT